MSSQPFTGEIYKTYCVLERGGSPPAIHIADFIYIDGAPYIVIEWRPVPGGKHPEILVPLDASQLTAIPDPKATHNYAGPPVADPRRHN
ncbi:hypothetical protein [Komagataeibacter kakiaceti]